MKPVPKKHRVWSCVSAILLPVGLLAQVPTTALVPSQGAVGVGKTLQMALVLNAQPYRGLAYPGVPQVIGRLSSLNPYSIRWRSSDVSVATVDQNGRVSGVHFGAAAIGAIVVMVQGGPQKVYHSVVKVGVIPVATIKVPPT